MRAVILILIVGLGLWLVYRHFELLQKSKTDPDGQFF